MRTTTRNIIRPQKSRRGGLGSLLSLLVSVQLACSKGEPEPRSPNSSVTASGGEQFEYDALHRLTRSENANGQTLDIVYNPRGQLEQIKEADQTGCSATHEHCLVYYEYDSVGNRTLMKDPTGVTNYVFDDLSRLESLRDPQGHVISYGYDAANRVTSVTYPSGRYVEYKYGPDGDLAEVRDASLDGALTLRYQPKTGLLERATLSKLETTYAYDELGRLTEVLHQTSSQQVVARYTYGLDAIGRATSMTSLSGGATTTETYGYDLSGNLTLVEYNDGRTLAYGYDLAGNRTSFTDSASKERSRAYVYGEDNRLTQVNDGQGEQVAVYRYDEVGNVTERFVRGAAPLSVTDEGVTNGLKTTYEYDYRNLLTAVKDASSGRRILFSYNGDGLRTAMTVESAGQEATKTYYVVDPNARQSRVIEEREQQGELLASFIYVGDRAFAMKSLGEHEFLLADRIGTVRVVTDHEGVVKEDSSSDPFFDGRTPGPQPRNRHRFTGEWFDDETGLVYLRARYYDPRIGRFISKDPSGIRGGSNMYRYVGNDPVNARDPSGRVQIRGDNFQKYLGTAQDWLNTTLDFVQANGWVPTQEFSNTVGVIGLIDSTVKEPGNVEQILSNNPLSLSTEAWRTGDFTAVSSYAGNVTGHVGFATGTTWVLDSLGVLGTGGMGSLPVIPLVMGTAVGGFKLGSFFSRVSDDLAEELPGLVGDIAAASESEQNYLATSVFRNGVNPFAQPSFSQKIEGALISPQIDFGIQAFDPLSNFSFGSLDGGLKLDLGSYDYFTSQWGSGPLSTWNYSGFSLNLTHDPFGGSFAEFGPGTDLLTSFDAFGGVLINEAATLVGQNVNDIEAAFFDPKTAELILLGDGADDNVPGLEAEYLKGALLSVFGATSPASVSLELPASLAENRPPLSDSVDNLIKRKEHFETTILYHPVWDDLRTKITVRMVLEAVFRGEKIRIVEQDIVPIVVKASGPEANCDVHVTAEDFAVSQTCADGTEAPHCFETDSSDLPLLSVTLNKDCIPGRIEVENCSGESLLVDGLLPNQRIKRGGLWWERDENDVYRLNGRAATVWIKGEMRGLDDFDDPAGIELEDAKIARHFADLKHPSRIDLTFRNQHKHDFYFRRRIDVYSSEHHRIFGGQIEGTRVGWVMYEADRMIKCLAAGACYQAGDPKLGVVHYNSDTVEVPGFQNFVERWEPEQGAPGSGVSIRLWFATDEMIMRRFAEESGATAVTWDAVKIRLLGAEELFGSEKELAPAYAAFVDHFNENLEHYMEQSFVVSDPDHPGQTKSVRIFDELRKVMQAVAVARFLRDNRIPIDMSWAEHARPKFVDIPRSVPVFIRKLEENMIVSGGVEGRLRTDYNSNAEGSQGPIDYVSSIDAEKLRDETVGARPDTPGSDVDAIVWGVGQRKAVSAQVEGIPRVGKRRLTEIDLSFHKAGGVLSFLRSYDGARLAADHGFGGGWDLTPLTLEFEQPPLRDALRKMHVWRDQSMNTHLRVGRARVVNRISGGVLDFHSTLDPSEYGIRGGLNPSGRPDFIPALRQNGATLSQLPEDQGYKLEGPSGTVHHFDTRGRLILSEDSRGRASKYQYDSGSLRGIVDEASGRQIQIFRDEEGLIQATEGPYPVGDPRNTRVEYAYTDGRLTKVVNLRSGIEVTYRYDGRGRLLGRVGADGQETIRDNDVCDAVNPPPCCDDGLGRACSSEQGERAWQFTFDRDASTDERSVEAVLRAGTIATLSWQRGFSAFGQLDRYVDSNGATHSVLWDGSDSSLPNGYDSPLPGVLDIRSERDLDGIVKIFNPNNLQAKNAPELQVEWLGKNESGEFDTSTYIGKPYALVNADGNRIEFEYEEGTADVKRVIRHHNGERLVTQVERILSPTGDRITLTDPSGAQSVIELNAIDLVTRVSNTGGIVWSYEYDVQDRVWRVHVPTFTGAVDYVEYAYDKNDRVTSMKYPDGSQIQYKYDPRTLRLAEVTDRIGRVTTYEYDELARPVRTVVEAAGPGGEDLARDVAYNAFGSIQVLAFPGGSALSYEPDELGRLGHIRVGNSDTLLAEAERVPYCHGETTEGPGNWVPYGSSGVYIDVDTSKCGLSETPVYLVSLEGQSPEFNTKGVSSVYRATPNGFRVYLRTPAKAGSAQTNGWRIQWQAIKNNQVGEGFCSGRTPEGTTPWRQYGTHGLYVDIDTEACGYDEKPRYLASLGGNSKHWVVQGASSIYFPTKTGFRIYIRSPQPITPEEANKQAWIVYWRASPRNESIPGECTGQTSPGEGWQDHAPDIIAIDVSKAGCPLSRPVYMTSLEGSSGHWDVDGVTSIERTEGGFRVYLRRPGLTAADAAKRQWSIQWVASK